MIRDERKKKKKRKKKKERGLVHEINQLPQEFLDVMFNASFTSAGLNSTYRNNHIMREEQKIKIQLTRYTELGNSKITD